MQVLKKQLNFCIASDCARLMNSLQFVLHSLLYYNWHHWQICQKILSVYYIIFTPILLGKLKAYGVQDSVLRCFASYLTNWKQLMSENGACFQPVRVVYKIPHGPVLFLIMVDGIDIRGNNVLHADEIKRQHPLRSCSVWLATLTFEESKAGSLNKTSLV